jgi:hypothetical protein
MLTNNRQTLFFMPNMGAQMNLQQIACGFVLAVLCLAMAVGCGSHGPTTVPVHGKVTFGGGPLPKAGKIFFLPAKPVAGLPNHPGEAAFDTDGRFVVGTFTKTDGLVPGSYEVRVECWETPPMYGGPRVKSCLPQAYLTPQWTLEVKPGDKPLDLTYDVHRGK